MRVMDDQNEMFGLPREDDGRRLTRLPVTGRMKEIVSFGFGKINCGLRREVCFAQRAREELWWENHYLPTLPGSAPWSVGKLTWKVRESSGLDEGSRIWKTNCRRAGIAKVRSVRATPCPAPDNDLPSWGLIINYGPTQ